MDGAVVFIIILINKIMSKNYIWWLIEVIVWYTFSYALVFSCQNKVNVGWVAFIILLLGSFGVFASPLTRHLSIWNKVLDKIIKKEEEREKY
jgi:hypothetical protein